MISDLTNQWIFPSHQARQSKSPNRRHTKQSKLIKSPPPPIPSRIRRNKLDLENSGAKESKQLTLSSLNFFQKMGKAEKSWQMENENVLFGADELMNGTHNEMKTSRNDLDSVSAVNQKDYSDVELQSKLGKEAYDDEVKTNNNIRPKDAPKSNLPNPISSNGSTTHINMENLSADTIEADLTDVDEDELHQWQISNETDNELQPTKFGHDSDIIGVSTRASSKSVKLPDSPSHHLTNHLPSPFNGNTKDRILNSSVCKTPQKTITQLKVASTASHTSSNSSSGLPKSSPKERSQAQRAEARQLLKQMKDFLESSDDPDWWERTKGKDLETILLECEEGSDTDVDI
ncbi:hypothetical protein BKA69DRAFT_1091573 [Paraphysoderma sedebokerense]|nr:hypothetical protein BKA69DRAFT_1091573 [Paraphysoderma sedebokerense]